MTPSHTKKIIVIICFCLPAILGAQNKEDSLKKIINGRSHDTMKLKASNNLINYYWNSDLSKALSQAKTALAIAVRYKDPIYIAGAYNNMAGTYYYMGNYQNALLYNFKTLNTRLQKKKDGNMVGPKKGIASCYSNIASIYNNTGKFAESIDYNLKALKIKEELKDSLGIAKTLTNIGNVYESSKNVKEALRYQGLALEMMRHLDNEFGISACYNNIGNIYLKSDQYAKAKQNFEKAIDIRKKSDDIPGLNATYNNMGELYMEQKKYAEAKPYFELAWTYFEQTSDMWAKSAIAYNLGEIYRHLSDLKKATEYYEMALGLTQRAGIFDIEKNIYDGLARVAAQEKNFEKAYQYHKRYSAINDTIYKVENSKKMAELQAMYDDAHKSQQIESLKREKIKSELMSSRRELEVQKQRNFKNLFLVGLVLFGIVAYMFFNRLSLKNKLNKKLEIQNHEIAEKNKEITDSIYYARQIQRALITSEKYIERTLDRLNKN